MFKSERDGVFRPAIQKTSTLVLMALMAVVCFAAASLSRIVVISDYYETKIEAARRMQAAMELLKSQRLEAGVFIDLANDPNETGLVGTQFSLITTDEGDLDAKLTTLDPNFAAGMVELLGQAQVAAGDTVAVMLTGSMPGANLAVLIACQVMGIYPVCITSVGASQWGANLPDFTWLDMEAILFENGMIPSRSRAASLGGRNDMGRLLSPRGRELIVQNIRKHGIPQLQAATLTESIEARLEYLAEVRPLRDYRALVNVGGGVASLGTSFNPKLLPPGLVLRRDIEAITRSGGIEGVMARFARWNIPVIHILNIQGLTGGLGMPYSPIPWPEIGTGTLYAVEKYNPVITALCLLLVAGMVYYIGYRSHQQIKQRMMEHEPDSVL